LFKGNLKNETLVRWWNYVYFFPWWDYIFSFFNRHIFAPNDWFYVFFCFKMKSLIFSENPKDESLWRLLPTLMILEHGDGSLVTAAIYSCFLAKHLGPD